MRKFFTTFGLFLITTFGFAQETKYVDTELLNVRSGAGTKYDVIDKISQGEKVTAYSTQGTWTEIELNNGTRGYVSTKFLSNTQNQSSTSDKKGNSWVGYILVIGFILYGLNKILKFFGGSSSSSQKTVSQERNTTRRKPSGNSAVYRFRVKGNGSAGGVQYVDGMNIEVAVSGLGAGGSPFNNIVEKLFVQESARKYNVEPRFHSSIKSLFKRDRLDVEIL